MKKLLCAVAVLLVVLASAAFVTAEIRQIHRERGGADLQNVNDRVLCVDGFTVFQTIVFAFDDKGGSAVSNIQLMEEKNGKLVPVRCQD
ncbi:MAG: hypothetical protein PVG19_06155 [Desulfobacterales bacterium]|jgi:hypothetical protein